MLHVCFDIVVGAINVQLVEIVVFESVDAGDFFVAKLVVEGPVSLSLVLVQAIGNEELGEVVSLGVGRELEVEAVVEGVVVVDGNGQGKIAFEGRGRVYSHCGRDC